MYTSRSTPVPQSCFARLCLVPGLLLAALLSACAGTAEISESPPLEESTSVTQIAAPSASEPEPEPVYRAFPEDTLYALLVAEFAARRGDYALALENYTEQAELTRDPGVAARAARMARYLKQGDSAAANAELWAQISPEHPEAQFSAATELGKAGKPMEALPYMERLDALGGNTNFSALAASALNLDVSDRQTMLDRIEALPQTQGSKNDEDRALARAILLQSLERNDEALALAQSVSAARPDNLQALMVEMQIYRNLGDEERALSRMAEAVERAPENNELRLQFARVLGRTDLAAAQKQFETLVEKDPDNAEYRLALALVYRENAQFDSMRSILEQLIVDGIQANTAHLYLAQDAERRSAHNEAIDHYLAMTPSQFFAPSIARAGTLMLESGGPTALHAGFETVRVRYPDQALQFTLLESQLLMDRELHDAALTMLSRALEANPDNVELLYSRSLVNEKRRDMAAAESDLRTIIRTDPNNAMALNALGYTLTNLSDRHEEALALIQRALEIKPDDPAIMDSLGWAYYRLGRMEEALAALEKAYRKFPDPEVAAHLGEVLWQIGNTEQAMAIWGEALKGDPDSRIVRETMQRLGADAN